MMANTAYVERHEAFINGRLNKSVDEIVRMSAGQFRKWSMALRNEIARIWREEDAPPFFRSTTEEIQDQLASLSRYQASKLLARDELTGELDCLVANGALGSSACRAFFPNLDKTKDRSESQEGISLWDYVSEPHLADKFLRQLDRNLRPYAFRGPKALPESGLTQARPPDRTSPECLYQLTRQYPLTYRANAPLTNSI